MIIIIIIMKGCDVMIIISIINYKYNENNSLIRAL